MLSSVPLCGQEEEVLGIDDDDEDIEIYEKQLHRFKSRGYHDDMGSDLEDGDKHDSGQCYI